MHFNTVHLEEMGMVLCRSLLDYINPTNTVAMDVVKDLEAIHRVRLDHGCNLCEIQMSACSVLGYLHVSLPSIQSSALNHAV